MIQIKKTNDYARRAISRDDRSVGEDTYTYEKEDVTIVPSKYYQCTLTMTKTAGPY